MGRVAQGAHPSRTALRWPIRRPRMVLSDVDIKRYIEAGKIKIAPDLPPEQFGSCSVDFRLGSEFNVFEYSRHPYIDLRDRTSLQHIMRTIEVGPDEPFVLHPRDFVLAVTHD